ncbi:ABC transporter permease [Lapidilactobacillus bayanensis]|uniref:ABC transporter permease n=1 Tax=Lapidilactobacillus bayanensis TaxID=2485998 RepID=UPI000F76651F|nr:ABC transporter permease [Lapidilactobacillus bayanensis]
MLYHAISKDLKANTLLMTFVAIALACLLPLLFNLAPTAIVQAAMPGELFVPLIAIICLPTVFLPDQSASIQAVINSKHFRLPLLQFARILWFLLILSLLDISIVLIYRVHTSPVSLLPLLADFMTKNLLLAGVVVISYRLTKNIAVTYILPMTYFALCLGYAGLGSFNLLTLMHGRPITDCRWQLLLLLASLIPDDFLKSRHADHT